MEQTAQKKAYYYIGEEADAAIKKWWHNVHDNPGERALLRRCSTPSEVACSQPFIRLMNALGKKTDPNFRIASIAGLLAHLRPVDNAVTDDDTIEERENDGENQGEQAEEKEHTEKKSSGSGIRAFGSKLGETSGGKALISGLRFRRFLQANNPDERYRLLVRILRIIRQQGHAISPLSVAATVYWWDNNNTRQQLAFGYYSKAPDSEA